MLPKRLAAGRAPGLGYCPQTRTNPKPDQAAGLHPQTQTEPRQELWSAAFQFRSTRSLGRLLRAVPGAAFFCCPAPGAPSGRPARKRRRRANW
eukprot:239895-Alexandrium_andersonii.AAC.1